MKVIEITSASVKRMPDKELTNMHLRLHQLYGKIRLYQSTNVEFGEMLREKHKLIVREILKRDMEHKTPMN